MLWVFGLFEAHRPDLVQLVPLRARICLSSISGKIKSPFFPVADKYVKHVSLCCVTGILLAQECGANAA